MRSLRLFTLAVCAAAIVPRVAHRGMFVDGVTYASIARNLAAGRGSFWSPSYTATLYPVFHEHPPLGFWLQSWWFRMFGDHLFVERVYTVAVAAATAVLIAVIWRRLPDERPAEGGPDRDDGGLEWLPILLWIAVPVVSWSIVGNLLETTMSLFTTAALATALGAACANSRRGAWGWAAISGVSVAGAVLTKGPAGLFPLVAPIVFTQLPGARRTWLPIGAQWLAAGLCALAIVASPPARESLGLYVNEQVIAAVTGGREVSQSSFTILKVLLQGVWAPMIGVGIAAASIARGFQPPAAGERREALCWFAVGLAGTLPILASAKQAGHYLVPAVPAFAVSAAIVLRPTMALAAVRLAAASARAVVHGLTIVIGAAAAAGVFIPQLGRDRARLADLDHLRAFIPRGAIVGICPAAYADWGLHAWLERLFDVSLDGSDAARREWFLSTSHGSCAPSDCEPISETGRALVLIKCRRAD